MHMHVGVCIYVCMYMYACMYVSIYLYTMYVCIEQLLLAQGSRVGGLYVQALMVHRVKGSNCSSCGTWISLSVNAEIMPQLQASFRAKPWHETWQCTCKLLHCCLTVLRLLTKCIHTSLHCIAWSTSIEHGSIHLVEANVFHLAVLSLTESTSTQHILDSRREANNQLLFHPAKTMSHEKLHDNVFLLLELTISYSMFKILHLDLSPKSSHDFCKFLKSELSRFEVGPKDFLPHRTYDYFHESSHSHGEDKQSKIICYAAYFPDAHKPRSSILS